VTEYDFEMPEMVDGPLRHAGQGGDGDVLLAVVDDVLVDLVGDGEQVVGEQRSAICCSSAREKTLPEGLLGLLKRMARVARGDGLAQPVGIEGEARRLQRHQTARRRR